jgi:hypothetical protein
MKTKFVRQFDGEGGVRWTATVELDLGIHLLHYDDDLEFRHRAVWLSFKSTVGTYRLRDFPTDWKDLKEDDLVGLLRIARGDPPR